MRLTLRTMLAYLDNILDAGEQEDIGQKIEESGFASEVVHRTRGVMRRLRLNQWRSPKGCASSRTSILPRWLPAFRFSCWRSARQSWLSSTIRFF